MRQLRNRGFPIRYFEGYRVEMVHPSRPKGEISVSYLDALAGGSSTEVLKANYLAEKKRLWKKTNLRPNEDMADYFDAKVDLQAYVFDANLA
jgi:hypothetical protein